MNKEIVEPTVVGSTIAEQMIQGAQIIIDRTENNPTDHHAIEEYNAAVEFLNPPG